MTIAYLSNSENKEDQKKPAVNGAAEKEDDKNRCRHSILQITQVRDRPTYMAGHRCPGNKVLMPTAESHYNVCQCYRSFCSLFPSCGCRGRT